MAESDKRASLLCHGIDYDCKNGLKKMVLGFSRFFCYALKLFTVVICECNVFAITTVKKYITWLLDFQDSCYLFVFCLSSGATNFFFHSNAAFLRKFRN